MRNSLYRKSVDLMVGEVQQQQAQLLLLGIMTHAGKLRAMVCFAKNAHTAAKAKAARTDFPKDPTGVRLQKGTEMSEIKCR